MNITKDTLEGKKIWLTRIMHEKGAMMNNIGNIRLSEGQVQQSPYKTFVESRISDLGAPMRKFHKPLGCIFP